MDVIDLKKEYNQLINDFRMIDASNPFAVLEWFYIAIDYHSMFLDDGIRMSIINKLSSIYPRSVDPKGELKNYNALIRKNNALMENRSISIANSLISLLIMDIMTYHDIPADKISMIQTFNELFNKGFADNLMFKNLEKNNGNDIIYTGIKDNDYFIKSGKLGELVDYEHIEIDNEVVPFISDNFMIREIHLVSGSILYNNNLVKLKETPKEEKEEEHNILGVL